MAESETNTPQVTPLEGTTTVDDKVTFEPQRLSYAAACEVAADIAKRLDVAGAGPIVIAGDAFLADLGNLGAATMQLDMLAEDFRRVAASLAPAVQPAGPAPAALGPALAVPALTAGLQGALGLVSLLRENVEFRGVTTSIDALAFEIALAVELRKAGVPEVFVPDLMVVQAPARGEGSIHARWQAVQQARQEAWTAVGPLVADLGRMDAELDVASRHGTPDEVTALSREIFQMRRRVEPLTETLSNAERRLNEIQAAWDKVNETTGLSMLARLLRAEALQAKAPRYLHAAVVASGGLNRVSRHLFRMIFLGDGLSAMGGVVVRWALLEPDGSVQTGGVRAARRSSRFAMRFDNDDGWPLDAGRRDPVEKGAP